QDLRVSRRFLRVPTPPGIVEQPHQRSTKAKLRPVQHPQDPGRLLLVPLSGGGLGKKEASMIKSMEAAARNHHTASRSE
ncbi:unnamed protein product, partial [Amoebophrya sp. A120]